MLQAKSTPQKALHNYTYTCSAQIVGPRNTQYTCVIKMNTKVAATILKSHRLQYADVKEPMKAVSSAAYTC